VHGEERTETQLGWLRERDFDDVDCSWKWLAMTLPVGVKPVEVDQPKTKHDQGVTSS
jgi:hypothetical protein